MELTPKIEFAIIKATELHSAQKTKLGNHPYITHPYSVAFIVSHYTDDEDTIAAALLHDVLEDVPNYSESDMINDFGQRVYDIVKELSEEKSPNDGEAKSIETWEMRKTKYIEKLETDSKEALLICCADKICNLRNMVEYYKKNGPAMFSLFHAPAGRQLWYYRQILESLKKNLGGELVRELENIFIEAQTLFSKN